MSNIDNLRPKVAFESRTPRPLAWRPNILAQAIPNIIEAFNATNVEKDKQSELAARTLFNSRFQAGVVAVEQAEVEPVAVEPAVAEPAIAEPAAIGEEQRLSDIRRSIHDISYAVPDEVRV